MSFADNLSSAERKHFQNIAICSAICGGISTQLIENNAPVVLFLTMLGANESFAMFSTSLPWISQLLLLIPGASLCAFLGLRRTYTISSIVGLLAFCIMAAAPFFGNGAKYMVLAGCFIYALTLTIYYSTWYPLLDNILSADDRSKFFSRMRFIYMIFMAIMLFLLGKFLQSKPELWLLQICFIVAGVSLLGRKFFMDKIPIAPEMQHESPAFFKSLSTCLHNRELVSFAFYMCCISMAFSAAMPLALVYMKTDLNITAGTVMIITSVNMAGKITGFFLLGKFGSKMKIKYQFILTHILAFVAVASLIFAAPQLKNLLLLFGCAFFLIGLVNAWLQCIAAVEMLALAKPGNKIMAIAFCMTAIAVGTAAGTLLTTILLNTLSAAEICGIFLSKYRWIFVLFSTAIVIFGSLLYIVPAVRRRS